MRRVNSRVPGGCDNHGTHCAGTVAASTFGVAKEALVVSVGVLDCAGDGTVSSIIAGLDYVVSDVAQRGVRAVASLSIGGGASVSEDRAIAAAHAAGISVVVAAGNENDDACNYSPAREPSAITVGSITSANALSSFSNYGTCVDILAPGSAIQSLSSSSDAALAYLSGTSMATPHVAGAVAQMRSRSQRMSADEASRVITCVATTNGVSGLPSGTPNLSLLAGSVFSDPYHPDARRCEFSSEMLPPLPPPPPPSLPHPPSPPSPPSPPPGRCLELCGWSNDNDCDDGGPGAEFSLVSAKCFEGNPLGRSCRDPECAFESCLTVPVGQRLR